MVAEREIVMSESARYVLSDRYYRRGESSPEQVMRRVAYAVAEGERGYKGRSGAMSDEGRVAFWGKRFYEELLVPLKFLPNSPTLANAGSESGCLSACFVRSPADNLVDILQTCTDWGMIEKYGGGVGASFDNIRPRGSAIWSTHGQALGPVAVMRMLATNAAEITQGAFRNGAHMGMLSIWHPDIRDFIHCKDAERLDVDTEQVAWLRSRMLQNFNISVKVTDEFMRAVQNNASFVLSFEKFLGGTGVEGPEPATETLGEQTVSARELWREICESAWRTGDPGIAFIDRVSETAPGNEVPVSSNPCGEEWLEQYGSCNLGSIDLSKFVLRNTYNTVSIPKDELPVNFLQARYVDWQGLASTVRLAVRFLNDVIEVNQFPFESLAETNRRTRRIGLGVMGWADMLSAMGIPYDSEDALQLLDKVGRMISDTAWDESAELASERGEYEGYFGSPLHKRRSRSIEAGETSYAVRNSSVITIAPTGTISLLAGCSSGIEPNFAYAWKRKILWQDAESSKREIYCAPDGLLRELEAKAGREEAEEIIRWVAGEDVERGRAILAEKGVRVELYRTAMEISPEWHIKHLAGWQRYASNSVSKTINLPANATVSDVEAAYWDAWKAGVKCVTVYRDGSKAQQVLNTGKPSQTAAEKQLETVSGPAASGEAGAAGEDVPNIVGNPSDASPGNLRPKISGAGAEKVPEPGWRLREVAKMAAELGPTVEVGFTQPVQTPEGKAWVSVTLDSEGRPRRVFVNLGKAGETVSSLTEALGRMVSEGLKNGVGVADIVEQLVGIVSGAAWDEGRRVTSVADGIALVLQENFLGQRLPKNGFGTKTAKEAEPLRVELDVQGVPGRVDTVSATPVRGDKAGPLCPQCYGDNLVQQEGCVMCLDCGHSKC